MCEKNPEPGEFSRLKNSMTESIGSCKKGWNRRGIFDEPKLSEVAAMYEELGFQVRLEPLDFLNRNTGCSECMKSSPERYRVLYTHR